MAIITIFRGFKIPVSILDAFLAANGVDETFGAPPLQQQEAAISTLLRTKMGEGDARVVIPQREAFSRSTIAYVAYCWINVFVQHQIRLADELPEQIPVPFEQLKNDILSYSSEQEGLKRDDFEEIGLFIVYTGSRNWTPEELFQREQPPVHCDYCDLTFDTFFNRQEHRQEVHGSSEGTNPLPRA